MSIPKNILIICIFGFVIRLWFSYSIPVNFDEAHNLLLARSSIFPVNVAIKNAYPPLFFSIWYLWQLVSYNIIWSRFLSVVFGSFSILITYIFLKKITSSRTATIASLLTAILPNHVFYTSIARMYAPGIFFATMFCLYTLMFIKEKRVSKGFFLVTLAGLYTHYYFILLWFLVTLSVVFFGHLDHHARKIWLGFSSLLFLFLIPLLYKILTITPIIGIITNPLIKLPLFFITPLAPWDIVQQLSIVRTQTLDLLSLIAICLGIFGSLTLMSYILNIRRLGLTSILVIVYISAPLLIWLLLHLGYALAGLRSFTIFFPIYIIVTAQIVNRLNIWSLYIVLVFITIASMCFCSLYILTRTGPFDPITSFYQNRTSEDTIAYSDIILYLPTLITNPHGTHALLHPGYLDSKTQGALGIITTSVDTLVPNMSLWYVKQHTNWIPFDQNADTIENYFKKKYRETERLTYDNFDLIRYDTSP